MRLAKDLIQLLPKSQTLASCRRTPRACPRISCHDRHPQLTETRTRAHSTAVLHNTQSFLRNLSNGAEVFLVGTAHISKQSAEEVREVIHAVKPDTIFVELCEQRAKRLRNLEDDGSFINQIMNMFSGLSGGPGSVAELFLRGFYKYLELIGFSPGMEFKVAMQEASARKAHLVLGDQPAEVTMQKLSQALTMQDVLSMLMGGMKAPPQEIRELYTNMSSLDKMVEGMKKRSVVKQMHDAMEQANPKLVNILVHERNAFMVDELYQLKGRIVAVVGLGHLDGMERLWNKKQGLL